ncbi:MAG: AIR carboxylase family protein, partial [Planctomycetes bacterium]|nr:AIR carboxylase family protein [Planctomycetota bacterium]
IFGKDIKSRIVSDTGFKFKENKVSTLFQEKFISLEIIIVCDPLIVVAGFEGALPSVLGGLVAVPLIAVPTSVGYGVAAGGTAALHAMLSSCAPGVTVVNIDNGFGAGFAAGRIAAAVNRR